MTRPVGERGSALVAVIGVMAVGLIITTLVMTSIVGAVSFTSSTRAGVQSQASAEAGIAVAHASLMAGTCVADSVGGNGNFTGTDPVFNVTVEHRNTPASAWTVGCPPSAAAEVRIRAAGEASARGVTASGNDTTHVEALLATPLDPTEIAASGAAIYAFSSAGFGGSGTLVSVNGSEPDVHIRHGDVVCDGASGGARNIIVADGALKIAASCGMTGNAWSSKRTTLEGSANVGGNVVADGVTFSGSARVKGNVWSTGSVTMPGSAKLDGNLVGTQLKMDGSSVIGGNVWLSGGADLAWSPVIGGHLWAKSLVEANKGSTSATISPSPPAGPPAPSVPVVPDWVDFDYDLADWTGFAETSMSGPCVLVSSPFNNPVQNAVNTLSGAPGVIDARGCTNGVTLEGSNKINLTNDLVIIANKFDLKGSASFHSTSDIKVWLITPDDIDDDVPSCKPGSSFNVGGSFSLSSNISAMVYTPCAVNLASSTHWRGQIFAGRASVAGSAKVAYDPVGLPGVDLSTGVTSGSGGTTPSRQLVATRNISPPAG